MNEPPNDNLIELAKAAELKNKEAGMTSEEVYDALLEGIRNMKTAYYIFFDSIASLIEEQNDPTST